MNDMHLFDPMSKQHLRWHLHVVGTLNKKKYMTGIGSAIPGNLPKSNVESNIQWGNRSVPPLRIASQTQIGQLQSAAASPGVLRGDTGEMSCTFQSAQLFLKQTNASNLVFSCTPGQYTGKGHVPVIYVDVNVDDYIFYKHKKEILILHNNF